MNPWSDETPFSLPDELTALYDVKSCVKYTADSGTYLLRKKESGSLYLLKTASDPLIAAQFQNERKLLDLIHASEDPWYPAQFPSAVFLKSDISENETFYIRTYIEGKTLEEICETNYEKPGIPLITSLDYLISLTDLLRFLHTMTPPLIHRDIKPQNIIVDPEGGCHFIDLGISRFYQPNKRSDTLVMGTQLTAPPEQFGYRQSDTRSDLYSLGIVLFYCLTGEYAPDEVFLKELEEPVARIIRRATMFDPDRRYQSADELLMDLLAVRFPQLQMGFSRPQNSLQIQPGSSDTQDSSQIQTGASDMQDSSQIQTGVSDTQDSSKQDRPAAPSGQTPAGTQEKKSQRSPWIARFGAAVVLCAGIFLLTIAIRQSWNSRSGLLSDEITQTADNSAAATEDTLTDNELAGDTVLAHDAGSVGDTSSADNIGSVNDAGSADDIGSVNNAGSADDTSSAENANSADNADPADTVYTFTEPLIEEAVRMQLGFDEDDRITESDLERVTELHIMGMQVYSDENEIWFQGDYPYVYDDTMRESGLYEQTGTISSLEDLLHMPNLHTVCLHKQQISDISVLADESLSISELGLGYNPLTNLSPLEGNTTITSLNLAGLEITDTAVIATLENLKALNISSTGIRSLDGLENCALEELNIFDVILADYTELCSLEHLVSLEIDHLANAVMEALGNTSLTTLFVHSSNGMPLESLSVVPTLEDLSVVVGNMDEFSLDGVNLPVLYSLDVKNATITDFHGLASLDSLTILKIYSCTCQSYDGLDEIPNLQILQCTEEQAEEIRAQYPGADFACVYG